MTTRHNFSPRTSLAILGLMLTLSMTAAGPVLAQDGPPSRRGVDWQRLNLSPQQGQQIQQLQSDWRGKYSSVMPQIHTQQKHLQDLFRNPQADPLEIVATQQSVMHLQEQLRNEATQNYLHKRAVLNAQQQKMLEMQMQEMVVARQNRPMAPRLSGNGENGGIMNIMEKVHWAIEPR
jgi:Spy/CpxP family protein refolding chaperone